MSKIANDRSEQADYWYQLLEPYLTRHDPQGEWKGHCPVHPDATPSASFNLEGGVWYCFGCGEGGSLEGIYIMLTERAEHSWIPPWIGDPHRPKDVSTAKVVEPLPEQDDIEEWHEDLLRDDEAMDYLSFVRGLSRREIITRKIVKRPDRRSGVRYGFPVYSLDGELLNVRWYTPKNTARGIRKRIWSVRGHGKPMMYPISVTRSADEICIVEGEFDALLLNSLGVPAVTVTDGAGVKWRDEWLELFQDKTVYIIPDRDEPGMLYGERVLEMLSPFADRIAIVELPYPVQESGGQDVSDYLLVESQPEVKVDTLKALLRIAIKDARRNDLRRNPDVRALKRQMDIRAQAEREHRREQILDSWQTPPSTFHGEEELSVPLPPLTFTVDQLHPEGSNSLLRSGYKVGKSTLLLNLLKSLCDGVPFLGMFDVNRQDRTAFWNYEVSRVQFNRWISEAKISDNRRWTVWHLRGHTMALDVEEMFETAVNWLKHRGVTCLIVDPFSRAYAGDENDNSTVGAWLDLLDRIKQEAGVSDLFMSAHYGRGHEERARGATRLEDWADVLWRLNTDSETRYFDALGRDVFIPESKLDYDHDTRRLEIVGGSRYQEAIRKLTAAAVEIVRQNPGQRTHHQLSQDLSTISSSASERGAAIASAVEDGLISLDYGQSPARYRPNI